MNKEKELAHLTAIKASVKKLRSGFPEPKADAQAKDDESYVELNYGALLRQLDEAIEALLRESA